MKLVFVSYARSKNMNSIMTTSKYKQIQKEFIFKPENYKQKLNRLIIRV